MRIKLDENLPERLVSVLTELGHDIDTASQEGLKGANDSRVWAAAQAAGRFLITKDLDFSDARRFVPGTHAGLLILRLADDRSRAVSERLTWVFTNLETDPWRGCLVVVSDLKVRVRRHQASPRGQT